MTYRTGQTLVVQLAKRTLDRGLGSNPNETCFLKEDGTVVRTASFNTNGIFSEGTVV